MKIGFTGTQLGMSNKQKEILTRLILTFEESSPTEAHHGDCIGSDAEFHKICEEIDIKGNVFIHPPIKSDKRAFCKSNYIFDCKSYLDRNHDIVDSTDFLIATPKEYNEVLRSGTWATIRYARKQRKVVLIILPNGDVN